MGEILFTARNISRLLRGKPVRERLPLPHEVPETYTPPDQDAVERVRRDTLKSGDFARLFWSHDGRRVDKWPHYFPIYERLFGSLRDGFIAADGTKRALRFLEIGVSHGGSLQIWRKYFGPDAMIVGVDIDPRCAKVDDANLRVRIGSQSDEHFMRDVVEEMGGIDIVLDDGSHIAKHQRASFDCLFPLLSEGGMYVVEDTQTAYWPLWEGGYRRNGQFIEEAKAIVDDMHAIYHNTRVTRGFAPTTVNSVQFFDGIVAFEKSKRLPSWRYQMGKKSFD